MLPALFIAMVFAAIAAFLSFTNDRLAKRHNFEKKELEDRLYKLSIEKDLIFKTPYTDSIEDSIAIFMDYLRNFFPYSLAASAIVKNSKITVKYYAIESISENYLANVKQNLINSLKNLSGSVPEIIQEYSSMPLNHAGPLTYLSSFHAPIIINNKVAAIIHISSAAQNLYKKEDIDDLHELIEIFTSSINKINQILALKTNKYTSLVEGLNEGVFMVDNQNNLLYINRACRIFLGLDRDTVSFFDVINVFGDLNLNLKINLALNDNNPTSLKQVPINSKFFDIFINPIGNKRVCVSLIDVTESKTKESQKEDLTNVMVHELRAPATTIKDSAELIISTKNLKDNKKIQFLEIIHQQSKKILNEIESILDTAKLEAGKLTVVRAKADISQITQAEIKNFKPQAQKKNISLTLEIKNKPPLAYFDTIRISQAIDNLLSNSLKFTPSGGKVTVNVDYTTISPSVDGYSAMPEILSLDKFIVVSVSDTGIGIAPDQQKLLFSKYTQANDTRLLSGSYRFDIF